MWRRKLEWSPYDPSWLVEVAHSQAEEADAWIAEALRKCTTAARTWDRASNVEYVYFVDPSRPNKPGSAWQLAESVTLETPDVDLNVDVSEDRRVLGVELLWVPGKGPSRPV